MLQVRPDRSGHHDDPGQERPLRLAEVRGEDDRHGPASAGAEPGTVRDPV